MSARVLVGSIAALITACCVAFAHNVYFRFPFFFVLAAIVAVSLFEYYRLARKTGIATASVWGIGFGLLYILFIFLRTQSVTNFLPEIILGVALVAFFIHAALRFHMPLASIGANFLGLVYIAVPFGLLLKIVYFYLWREGADPLYKGSFWLAFLLLITKGTDMGAFFVGRQFGKTKLAPTISPGKTVAGLFGGVATALVLGLLSFFLAPYFGIELPWWVFLILALLLALAGQLGDLAESLLKRDAKVKDSNAMAGMGGILDMVDSLLFTTPILYIFLRMSYS